MTVLLTCGAAWEPIDGMRRLTNASTGRLGTELADTLSAAGLRVVLFRAETATAPWPGAGVEVHGFSTNDDLAAQLRSLSSDAPDVVLHAAALCDFRVVGARTAAGTLLKAGKLPSREGRLSLELEPATKVLPQLRTWFPRARIVGWKYEVDGDAQAACEAGLRQMRESGTAGCVVNGPAWGPGYGWCAGEGVWIPCPTSRALADALIGWIGVKDSGSRVS